MKIPKLPVFYLLLIFLPVFLRAQSDTYGAVSIASPTAAALGKYADIPVSYHTGIPQINIPFYTVKAGSLELPIGLSYHASGLKVIETASWVGAGWSLDAGGVITRTVMGLPDEKNTGNGQVDIYGYYTDSGYNKYLYQNGSDQDWQGFAEGRKDGEPDLFFFNFGGYSGKFFFRDDHTAILVPQQDIKIIPWFPNPGSASIQGFTLITPDGNQYIFGNTPGITGAAPIEVTNSFSWTSGATYGSVVSSWYLNKVISYSRMDSIRLTYASENYGYYNMVSGTLDTYTYPGTQELSLVKNIISGVRLSQISFPNGTVTFVPGTLPRTDLSDNGTDFQDNVNTQSYSLASVNIQNTDNSFCKNFKFYYSYFQDNTTAQPTIITTVLPGYTMQTDRLRLRLDSVGESTCDSLLRVPSRSFSYYGEQVPRRLSLGIDHWGFSNGETSNQSLIPTYTTTNGATITTFNGAQRNAEWPAMRAGALTRMTVPTGGSQIFDFEPADNYSKTVQTSGMAIINNSSMVVHTFHQGSFNQTVTFVSNGNPMTMNTFNSSSYSAYIVLSDSLGQVYATSIGDNNYDAGSHGNQGETTHWPPMNLHPGTYTATLTIPTGPADNEGATASFSQILYGTNTYGVIIGGLRIKTITQQDSVSNSMPVITSYSYPNGGFLYSFPTYVSQLRNDMVASLGFWEPGTGFGQTIGSNAGCPFAGAFYFRTGGSLRPMASVQGYHIGFPTVKVTQPGNGYSLYVYHTGNSGYGTQSADPTVQQVNLALANCDASVPNYPAAPLPFDFLKGELAYEQHVGLTGNQKTIYYSPTFDTDSIQPAPAFIVAERTTLGSSPMLLGTLYNVSTARKTSMHVEEVDNESGTIIQTDTYTYYGSPYHNQVTRKVTSTSTGDSLITKMLYAQDFHSSSWDVSPSCETTYTNTCKACLVTDTTALDHCGSDPLCPTNTFLAYRKCLSDARNAYVNSRFANYTGINASTGLPSNTYVTNHAASRTAAGAELKPILDLQDENRVVPIEITDYRDNSLLKSNFTRYDYMPYPANIPFPNKTQLVNLADPGATFNKAVISGTTLTKDSRYLDESTYGFNRGNVTRVTGHDGLNTMYIWDYLNTNPIAKTISATTDSTAFSSFEADGTGNWTLTTGGGNTSQVSVSVAAAATDLNTFTNQTPLSGTVNDHMPTTGQELGMKFTSSVAGTVKGVRFYKTSGNTGTHIGELYSSAGTRLAQATFTGETSTGWQTVNFSSPVSITANTTYTVAYFSSAGNFTEDDNYFLHNSVTNGVLTAPADGTNGAIGITDPGNGQGTFKYTSSAAFPDQLYEAANYWVDVIFTPTSTAFANAGLNQTITLPTSTVVLNGSGSTGTITSYSWTKVSGPGSPVILSPTSTFSTVTGLSQGAYVFQLSLNSGASTAQVTVNVNAAGTPTNIYTTQTPVTPVENDGTAIELGVKFRTSTAGSITGIRFYKSSGNGGTHIGELYSYPGGTRLAQATFSGETTSGWQTVLFSTPVTITPNTTYVAAYWSSAGNYTTTHGFFGSPVTNGTLTGLADGTDGHNSIYKYATSAAYPGTYTVEADKPTYWVDVLFVPDNTPIPSAGSNLSVTLPVSSVTLNGSNSSGNISNYLWTKVSGPGSPVIVSPTSATTNVTGLSAGNYVFQLAVNGASNSAFALTGTKSYNMTGNTVSKSGLTSGKKYIVSYWTRGSALSIAGGTSTSTTGRSVNGWTYYEHVVTMTSTTVTITGSGYIDELRLYPQGAQMTSYTYQRLTGLTSMNDPNSEITYYDYDGLQRLKNIKDYQGNIVKNYQYNYAPPKTCDTIIGNYTLAMQTFAGTNTLSYPVGVFNVNYKLLGNAANPAQYISLWMSDTTDSHIGSISIGQDSMHFVIALNGGRTLPANLLGMRYYQYDLAYNVIDGFNQENGEYVDFGDGITMYMGKFWGDTTTIIMAPNTTFSAWDEKAQDGIIWHTYPDSTLKTLTFYHNDGQESFGLWPHDVLSPAISLTKAKNLRGYCPQHMSFFELNSYQQKSALSVDSLKNWNSIANIYFFTLSESNRGLTTCSNIGYRQDFMQYQSNLFGISTAYDTGQVGYYDTTFKLSKLKSNWNSYFARLDELSICDEHWNREDLSGLLNLTYFRLVRGNQNHSNSPVGNSPTPIPSSIIDNIINQIAAGAGLNNTNGTITIITGGPTRTALSDTAYNFLLSKGWTVDIETY